MAIALPLPQGAISSGYANNTSQSHHTAQPHQSNQATQVQSRSAIHQDRQNPLGDVLFSRMLQHMQTHYPARPQGGNNALERLPRAAFGRVCRLLGYRDLICLRQLSRALYAATDPQVAPEEDKIALVLRAERHFPQNYGGGEQQQHRLGCFLCFQVRPTECFARAQPALALRPGLPGRPIVRMRRFCVDCGVREGLHEPGDRLDLKNGARIWVVS
jgi:hypothetical protein